MTRATPPPLETAPASARPRAGALARGALPAALVFALTAAVFWPAGEFEFLNYDDVVYVTGNAHVRAGLTADGARWALGATDTAANWHPLTWLAHMLDVELFGLDPRGHHLASVLWHALAASLFFLALSSLLRSRAQALAAALLFALHPLRVEAVAMVADRKDLLAGCAGAATLWAWLGWCRRGGSWRLALALGCYAAGLAAKPTLLTWFALLWLVARPPFVAQAGVAQAGVARAGSGGALGRARPGARVRLALLGFAALALGALALTLRAQTGGGAFTVSGGIPLPARLANACAALWAYAADTVWPAGLAFFYPHPALVPGAGPAPAEVLLGLLLALLGSALAFGLRRRFPAVWLGWLWFLLTLLPTLGFVQIGLQARADRYTYLPSVGWALALAAGLAPLLAGRPLRRAATAGTLLLVLAGLALATRTQLQTWRDTSSLAAQALRVTDHNFVAHANLGGVLEGQGRGAEALEELQAALAIRPGMLAIQLRAAGLAQRLGRAEQAAAHYAAALELEPDHVPARLELAGLLAAGGDERGAASHLAAVFEAVAVSERERLLGGQALAWILATTPDDGLRDGARAAQVAEACLALERSPQVLDALAAARAEQGRFEAAQGLVQEALRGSAGASRAGLEQRLERYRAGRPWRRP